MSQFTVDKKYTALYDSVDPDKQKWSIWRKLGAEEKAKNIIDLCSDDPHENILEIGCGDGAILNELSEKNFGENLYGLEISKAFVDSVNGKNIKNLKACSLYDGYTIPYEDNMFDLVILSHIVEHLEYPRRLINEAKRVGRMIVIEVPLEDTLRLKKNFISNPVGHINIYTLQSLRVLLESCDLKIKSSKITNPSLKIYKYIKGSRGVIKYFIRAVVLLLTGKFATHLFTYHYIVLCKKSSK